jgi:ABC-type dipeptide/oligopeptide/nickel transport system ATPase component
MSSVLNLRNVTVQFEDGGAVSSPAVQNFSLDIVRGEIFGIVGESGSGKSTIANAIMGLLPSSAHITGSVTFGEREVLGLNDRQLRELRGNEMAMIFQDASASLDPTWSVGDQIAETIRAHNSMSKRAARERAVELMNEVGIPGAAARYGDAPHRLSGGMRQRVVIAAALANNPVLLIADEPTTALDVTIQAQVLALIQQLRVNHGTTVVLITHDLGVIAQVCDRVGVMHGGRLLEVATVTDVFANPQHPYTRALLAASPGASQRGKRLPVIPAEWSVESLRLRETENLEVKATP